MHRRRDVVRADSDGRSWLLGVLALVAALGVWVWATSDSAAQTRTGGFRRASQVIVGKPAPDFELPSLTFTTNDEGKSIGLISETETFKLSSFRGKRPVCLIMSSYT